MASKIVLNEFRKAKALLEGHFVLSSGLHSRSYLQAARVLMNAKRSSKLCRLLAQKVTKEISKTIDYVISPAMGGVVVGYEMGRQLGVEAMFLERVKGVFELRRGFTIPKKNGRRPHILMVEDIVTTGLSSREAIVAIRKAGGNVVAATCLINRSGGKAKIGVKLISLAMFDGKTFSSDTLPDDLKKISAVKLGSRGFKG